MNLSDFTRLRQEVENLSNALDVFYTDAMVPIFLSEGTIGDTEEYKEGQLDKRALAAENFHTMKDSVEKALNNFDNYLDTLNPQQSTQRNTTTRLSTESSGVGGGGTSGQPRTPITGRGVSSLIPQPPPPTPQPPTTSFAPGDTRTAPTGITPPPPPFASGALQPPPPPPQVSQPRPRAPQPPPPQGNPATLTSVPSTTGSSSLRSSSDDPLAQKK